MRKASDFKIFVANEDDWKATWYHDAAGNIAVGPPVGAKCDSLRKAIRLARKLKSGVFDSFSMECLFRSLLSSTSNSEVFSGHGSATADTARGSPISQAAGVRS